MIPTVSARRAVSTAALALALGVGLAAVGVAAAAPRSRPATKAGKRPGKVVRVERNQPKVSSKARVCALYESEIGTCPREVAVGDVGTVVDPQGTYGQATVVEVTRVPDACGNVATWSISIDTGHLVSRDYGYNAVFVLDHPVVEGGRTLPTSQPPPAGRADEVVQHLIDDDADGQGDLMVTNYACDEHGQATAASRTSNTCFDTWIELRDEWRHARTDLVLACYR